MKLTDSIYLVGSGSFGFDLSDAYDCHVYLLDGGDELALVDAGAGMGAETILENVRREGLDPLRIRHIVLTHAHGDHAGGAARMQRLLDRPTVYLSRQVARFLREADERALSLDVAKQAGIYPHDYTLEPCEVDVELADGDRVTVGELTLDVLDTPGHCDGHVSLILERAGTRALFAGDVVFFGGKILLQSIYDCRLDAEIRSLRRLRGLAVDALLPGHLSVSMRDGQRHIERANEVLDRLLVPEQVVSAW
jgi:hydroxyacylglutathione hydrolase